MATTITVSEQTRRRLADYKGGDRSYDELLNALMDRVPLDDWVAKDVEEHYRRLKDFRPVPAEEFQQRLQRKSH